LHFHVQVITLAFELVVGLLAQRNHDVARHLARALLTRTLEAYLVPIWRSPLHCHFEFFWLLLAAVIRRHLLLLLHHETRGHLLLHHLDLWRTLTAVGTLRLFPLVPAFAVPTNNTPLDAHADLIAVVHVFEGHLHVDLGLWAAVCIPLLAAAEECIEGTCGGVLAFLVLIQSLEPCMIVH
jgi:hypothetical protein